MLLTQQYIDAGYAFIPCTTTDSADTTSHREITAFYEKDLEADGPRRRAYLKLSWQREGNLIVAEICKIYNISRPSFYNYLNNRRRELAKISTD